MEFPDSEKKEIDEANSCREKEILELEGFMEVLTRVDLDLAYSSEKLVNLNGLLMQLSGRENELEAMIVKNDDITPEFVEKTLFFNLLSCVLDSEVNELDGFMISLQEGIVEAHRKISSCRHLTEPYTMMEEKLSDSVESFKQTQFQISEVKSQSSKLQRTVLAFAHGKGGVDELSQQSPLSNRIGQPNLQIAGHRHILKMLEKSLSRELDLEKRLAESRKSEEELKLKLHYTEQVAFRMEETSQVVWGRFLEAENSSVVLKGISHEILSRFQLVHFNMNSIVQRETELKAKYNRCLEEIKLKDVVLETLKLNSAGNTEAEILDLREKVENLEEKLRESGIKLENAKTIDKLSQIRISELENLVESMRESIDISDTRAESAELKVAELTGTNVEITEELTFFKGSSSNSEKKVNVLEKQLREAEIALQHAKAASEASQEHQNMLYTAIFDMENLIEELKSKIVKADSKQESTEENCIILSETNAELTKEIGFLKDRIEDLEACLDRAKSEKLESANEIGFRTKLVMDMVVQLAAERERIQNQMNALSKENKRFAEKLGYTVNNDSVEKDNDEEEEEEEGDEKDEASLEKVIISNGSCAKSSMESVINNDSVDISFQLDERLEEEATPSNDDASNFASADCSNVNTSELQVPIIVLAKRRPNCNYIYICVAIFVSLLSVLAAYLINQKPFQFQGFFW